MSDLHLVGSIPYDTAREVFRTFGATLGPHLCCMPDGEIGLRRHWISRVHYQVFAIHPDIEVLRQPRLEDGGERLNPRDAGDSWRFRVRPGAGPIRFGEPGWRLGFARDALASYELFRMMQAEGVLAPHLRFQVSIPTPHSAAPPRVFETARDCALVRGGYVEALATELATILAHIPHDRLAIQWDCAAELQEAYAGALADELEQFGVSRMLPDAVRLGMHLCFGTLGGWPRFAPDDLGGSVALANALPAACGRRVDWIHIPVLDRSDDAFFAPLGGLAVGTTRIHLGMVHNMAGFAERLRAARRHLRDFGIGAFCGFGRMPPAALQQILADHLTAQRLLREASERT